MKKLLILALAASASILASIVSAPAQYYDPGYYGYGPPRPYFRERDYDRDYYYYRPRYQRRSDDVRVMRDPRNGGLYCGHRDGSNDRRFSVQDGVCKPARGY